MCVCVCGGGGGEYKKPEKVGGIITEKVGWGGGGGYGPRPPFLHLLCYSFSLGTCVTDFDMVAS